MKKVFNVFIICFLFANNITAQEELTISSAVKKTLENNLDIEVSENFKRIAKNNSSILNSNYLPNIQLGSEINTNIQSIEIETPRRSHRVRPITYYRKSSQEVNQEDGQQRKRGAVRQRYEDQRRREDVLKWSPQEILEAQKVTELFSSTIQENDDVTRIRNNVAALVLPLVITGKREFDPEVLEACKNEYFVKS